MSNKTLFAVLLFAFGACTANLSAQSILGRIANRVKQTVTDKIEQKIDQAVDGAIDGVLEGQESNDADHENAESAELEADPATATSSDFMRGDVIMFQDDLAGETVGEFPSRWDLVDGSAEVKTLGGQKAIEVTNNGYITPLIEEQGAYLPEEFTIEYDFYYWNNKENVGLNEIKLVIANTTDRNERADEPAHAAFVLQHPVTDDNGCVFRYNNGSWEYYKDTKLNTPSSRAGTM